MRHADDDDDDDGEGAMRPHMVKQAHLIFVRVLTLSPQTLAFFFSVYPLLSKIKMIKILYCTELDLSSTSGHLRPKNVCYTHQPGLWVWVWHRYKMLYLHPYPDIPMGQTRAGIETRANH